MRMWMIDPGKLCTNHLLGEHREIHMLAGSIQKGRNLRGFLSGRMIEPLSILARHNELVMEMKSRGYRHNSPLEFVPDTSYLGELESTKVDPERSLRDLSERCKRCRDLVES